MRRGLMILAVVTSLAACPAAAYDLSEHQWRHRMLFLVAPDGDDPELAAQQRNIEMRRDALSDREIRVFRLYREQGFVEDKELPIRAVTSVREQLGVTPEDRLLILIGKDGGVKRRTELDTDLRDVFLQIDAMPMRRDEMRAKIKTGKDVSPP
jgi:hypothetical protein